MNALQRVVGAPASAIEFANVLLTSDDAVIGATARDVVWTHRGVTLYRYRSDHRSRAVPILLVFALINRPAIFDLRPGSSLVEYLLEQGFDVFLLDWGIPGEEDADTASSAEPGRTAQCSSVYATWTDNDAFDPDYAAELWRSVPGWAVDFANKLLKPVTNFWSTNRPLWDDVQEGTVRRDAQQAMAKWIGDNPPFTGEAFSQWLQWLYRDDALQSGRVRLRGRRVNLRLIGQNLLVVTAQGDHIAPRAGTMPIFDLVCSEDVTYFDRPGGHIGLIAGSPAKHEIWPDLAAWLAERSDR